ncbi:hypothetical protein C0J52_21219 [Blattella germanica]|nr:hypothetical protein C0J52_21219 [Blattella germanica]
MAYTSSKLAVRDSFDDDDVSDDVEDEVFIRDGRNGFKVDEERGVKRPLMAPRRKTKSNQIHSELGGRPPCRAFCAPCCYGFMALAALIGVIVLVVSLVIWFPFPLDEVTKFWKVGKSSLKGGMIIPCTEVAIEDIWITSLPKLTVESAVRLNDVNGDGVMDVIIGHGTGADGHDVPDYVCKLYFGGTSPCLGGLIALDGRTGSSIWHHWTSHSVFTVDCGADITNDRTNDCLISGKGGVLQLVNGHDGSSIWQYIEQDEVTEPHEEPLVDIFAAQFVQDVDGDGLPDVLTSHTKDSNPGDTGQESPGGLYAVPMHHLIKGNMLQVHELYHDDEKGVMSPAVLVDINEDGSEDIVAAMFNSVIVAFNGLNFSQLWNFTFPNTETFSAPTPAYFNDDNIPDFLVKYQDGPGFPVYYSSQTTVLNGKTGVPLIEKPVMDTMGSQMGGITLSMEGLGNDFILFWIADCLQHEGPTKPYSFLPGTPIQVQSRADVCQLLYNSSLTTKFAAFSQHIEPPGIIIYSSESRKKVEYHNVDNTSAQAHHYLDSHPDFMDTYDISRENKILQNDKKGYEDDSVGSSNFRHRGSDSIIGNNGQGKGSSYYYNDGGDYMVANRGRNRVSNDCGEQEEMLNSEFQGNSEFPNIRKHGVNHPVEQTWRHQQPQQQRQDEGNVPMAYNLMDNNPASARDADYELLYGPMSAESLSGSSQGFPLENQEDKRTVDSRVKREESQEIHGLQRLTSLGSLAPPLWSSGRNDSIDLLLVTHWIYPMKEAQLILEKDKECIEKKQAEAEGNGKYSKLENEAILKACLGYKWKNKVTGPNSDVFNLNMGQATVYRLKITFSCRNIGSEEKCASILPYKAQNWPGFMGQHGNGHFRPRFS